MTRAQAVKLLRDYNAWRRGDPSPLSIANIQTEKIGQAIDVAIKALGGKGKA